YALGVIEFWRNLASSLEQGRPSCAPLTVIQDAKASDPEFTTWEPLKYGKARPEGINLTGVEEKQLYEGHKFIKRAARRLAPKLWYEKGKQGIVTTAGPYQIPILLVSLRMLRRTGSKIPVELFLANWNEYNATICEKILPTLNTRCRVLSDVYSQAAKASPPQRFQFKIFAILFSSFEHVLFLDADCFPLHDPRFVFNTEPYLSNGLVTWPDYWANTASSHYFHIAGIPEVPVSTRLSTESGQLLLNKKIHAASLIMMIYYNYYGPEYYYPLLCQGSHGAGDKETFIPAAMVMELPFYQVRTGAGPLGHWENGGFHGLAMLQMNPEHDYRNPPPYPTHFDPKPEVPKDEKPKPLFMHHLYPKLNPYNVLDEGGPARKDGKWHRMWPDNQEVLESFGYDVERRVWECIAEEACSRDEGLCKKARSYYKDVFG
ncbi:mannosyltransferase putative-domain-containing protein, partial [Clohesyomyces aquaticus]